jgi:hypothetical protein
LFKLNRKKKIFLLIFVCILFISVCTAIFIKNDTNLPSKTASTKEETTITNEETTMKEAISIASAKLKELHPDAKLSNVLSTDSQDKPSEKSGADGTRKVWNITFTDNKSKSEYTILISKGKAEMSPDGNKITRDLISDSDIKLDSTDALKIAKEQKGLTPGKDWAIGYHFNLRYASLHETPNEKFLMIEVIGLSPKGNFAHVDIDATNGKIVYAGEKTYDSQGKAIWNPF